MYKNKKYLKPKILIPQVVEPAHPPTNIKKIKKIKGNSPQSPKSSVTYPVPERIESTLKEDILKLSKKEFSRLFKNKYKNIIKIEINSKYTKPFI